MEHTKKLQDLIDEVLEITYGKYGAKYRQYLIENDAERYYILKASGELYEHILAKDLEKDIYG